MSDSLLKKEFDTRSVKRIRDLVTKKYGDATGIQVGYEKEHKEYEEGDEFEENGKRWVIKDGIKQSITKLDEFKKLHLVPVLCPKCSAPMKTEYDKKMFHIHKMCMDCVAKFETHLKITGQYQKYSDDLIMGNIKHYLGEYEEFLNDISKNIKNQGFVSEDGVIEKWVGDNKEAIDSAKKQLDDMKKSMLN